MHGGIQKLKTFHSSSSVSESTGNHWNHVKNILFNWCEIYRVNIIIVRQISYWYFLFIFGFLHGYINIIFIFDRLAGTRFSKFLVRIFYFYFILYIFKKRMEILLYYTTTYRPTEQWRRSLIYVNLWLFSRQGLSDENLSFAVGFTEGLRFFEFNRNKIFDHSLKHFYFVHFELQEAFWRIRCIVPMP